MEPTSLQRLLEEEDVVLLVRGISVVIHPHWIIKGEERLSYTSFIRLVECCREHHWKQDVLSVVDSNCLTVDSTTRALDAEFFAPIQVNSQIELIYAITSVRQRSYILRIVAIDGDGKVYARCNMVCVFLNPETHTASRPPAEVHSQLLSMTEPDGSTLP